MRMRALQLKLTLAHSVMSVKKHECARALRLSLCLGWEWCCLSTISFFLSWLECFASSPYHVLSGSVGSLEDQAHQSWIRQFWFTALQ